MNEITDVISLSRVELILERLKTEGFRPERAGENSIRIRCEARTLWVDVDANDEKFFQVIAANFWPIESQQELQWAYEAASHVGESLKVAKAYITADHTNVWIDGSGFFQTTDDFLESMVRLNEIFRLGITRFTGKMRALKNSAEISKLH